VDKYQFGFKAKHSTSLCTTNVFKKSVDYYTRKGSHVFTCFVDLSKAFDKVNYWKLFHKLLVDNIAVPFVYLLAFWYTNQSAFVRWNGVDSGRFSVGNGTRQGSVLSPYLFTRYIREVITVIAYCAIGCNIAGVFVNILAYADDIVLLAPSWKGLQFLIDIFQQATADIDMLCNVDKTVCMVFSPSNRRKIVASSFPEFHLGDTCLKFVCTFRYLGHIITNDQHDDNDIAREIRNLFVRTNILKKNFYKCSMAVKRVLFRSHSLYVLFTARC